MRIITPLLALCLAAGPVLAQDREPAQRQTLIDLAYVIGEAHALRQVCGGPNDQYWRDRMVKLIETESADRAFEERLRQTFNTGYVSRQAQYTSCSAQSREAETGVAAKGRALAQKLVVVPPRPPAPDSLAPN